MHRHAGLCAGAVDPLEIAAGLEAQGVTDRAAGRFRHRDVFGLAEELYARVPRGAAVAAGVRPASRSGGGLRVALHLVPGVVCAAGVVLADRWGPAVGAVAVPLTLAAVLAVLRRGPLAARAGVGAALWTWWLLGFAVCGEPVIAALVAPGPDALFTPAAAARAVALTLALAPAAWCAERFAVRARAHLAPSRSLQEFAGAVRPLLAGTLALFLLAQLALLAAATAIAGAPVTPVALAGPVALGVLLFTGRLLAVHGYPGAAATATGTACAAEALTLAAVLLHRLPPLRALAVPVQNLGPAAIAAVACGCAALALAAYALGVLSRASAHPHNDLEQ